MNKFTLMLQDREVIKELARDPEIQVKIKNSIVDEVKRRSAKGIDAITNDLSKVLKEEFFDSVGYFHTPKLKPAIKKLLERNIDEIVSEAVLDEKNKIDNLVKEALIEYSAAIRAKLAEIDIDKVIREEAAKIIERKFR